MNVARARMELLRRDRVRDSLAGTNVTSALHVGPCEQTKCGELDLIDSNINLDHRMFTHM